MIDGAPTVGTAVARASGGRHADVEVGPEPEPAAEHRDWTEAEIRGALPALWRHQYPSGGWPDNDWAVGWGAFRLLLDGLYDFDDLRPSEVEDLTELVEAAIGPIQDEAFRQATEAIVGVGVAFAKAHPLAPRSRTGS
jgi:hypothetical protein